MPLKLSHNSKRLSISNETSNAKRQRLDNSSTSDEEEPDNDSSEASTLSPHDPSVTQSTDQSSSSSDSMYEASRQYLLPSDEICSNPSSHHPTELNSNQSTNQMINEAINQTIEDEERECDDSSTNQVIDMLASASSHTPQSQSSQLLGPSIHPSIHPSTSQPIEVLHLVEAHNQNDQNDDQTGMYGNFVQSSNQSVGHSNQPIIQSSIHLSVINQQNNEQLCSSVCDKQCASLTQTTLLIDQNEHDQLDIKTTEIKARADKVRQLILTSDDSELQLAILATIDQWEQCKIKNATEQTRTDDAKY